MSQFITLIISISKAVPIVNDWIQELIVAFTNQRIDSMSKENRESIKKAIEQKDQRDLERAMGSINAGELSGIPGTVVVDKLPGVEWKH